MYVRILQAKSPKIEPGILKASRLVWTAKSQRKTVRSGTLVQRQTNAAVLFLRDAKQHGAKSASSEEDEGLLETPAMFDEDACQPPPPIQMDCFIGPYWSHVNLMVLGYCFFLANGSLHVFDFLLHFEFSVQ